MSHDLVAQIRKAREFRIPLDGGKKGVTAKRPTDVEMVDAQGKPFHLLGASHVVGWDGWIEDDVIGGGGSDPAPFSAGLWAEVYSDRPDLWQPISEAIIAAYRTHAEKVSARAKN